MIIGKNVILRMFREDDLDEYFEITNNLCNMSNYWPINLHSEPTMRKEFREHGFWKYDNKRMIITDVQGNLVGEVANFRTSPNIQGPEVGYRIFRKKDMGKGYMTEALTLFSAYLYKAGPTIMRLTLLIRSDNIGSIKVAEKCGYKHEGTLRNAWLDDGKTYTMEIFSLLRDECPKLEELLKKSSDIG